MRPRAHTSSRVAVPPPVPGPSEVPREALTALAAIANRPTEPPTWTTVREGGPTDAALVGAGPTDAGHPGAGPGEAGRNNTAGGTAWRELVDREGTRRIEVLIGGVPVIVLMPHDDRVAIGLVQPGIDHVVDVSIQPQTVITTLDRACRESGVPRRLVGSVARQAVMVATETDRDSSPSVQGTSATSNPPMPLIAVLGRISFPILGATYDIGAEPLDSVPRWAAPILASPTIGMAATVAFGQLATRPVRRALIEALRPGIDGRLDLTVLALALIGRRVLQPDRIARVLSGESHLHPTADLPDPATLEAASKIVPMWGDQRCERILIDAARRPDGMALLLRTVLYADQLGADGPQGRLPSRLDQLHDVYRVLMRTDAGRTAPGPGTGSVGTVTGTGPTGDRDDQRRAQPQPQPVPMAPHPVLAPANSRTPTGTTVRDSTVIDHRPAVRSLAGAQIGGLRLVLPRTVGDLKRWGRLLSNCLGDFGPDVCAGRSSIIGVERRRRLIYALEITNRGEIRQFNGRANRRPRRDDHAPVITTLVNEGVIDPRSHRNSQWFAAAGLDPARLREQRGATHGTQRRE